MDDEGGSGGDGENGVDDGGSGGDDDSDRGGEREEERRRRQRRRPLSWRPSSERMEHEGKSKGSESRSGPAMAGARGDERRTIRKGKTRRGMDREDFGTFWAEEKGL